MKITAKTATVSVTTSMIVFNEVNHTGVLSVIDYNNDRYQFGSEDDEWSLFCEDEENSDSRISFCNKKKTIYGSVGNHQWDASSWFVIDGQAWVIRPMSAINGTVMGMEEGLLLLMDVTGEGAWNSLRCNDTVEIDLSTAKVDSSMFKGSWELYSQLREEFFQEFKSSHPFGWDGEEFSKNLKLFFASHFG